MGVRGLQGFVGSTCPHICTAVNFKELAEQHRSKYPGCTPTIVVDAMCCLKYWYTPESWICGGQWREYYSSLRDFVKTFTAVGIKLIFFFDGMVEQDKRDEWVKRRLKNNREISRIFHYIKSHREQPGRNMFFIPSGLAIFTRFALKTLGQKTLCTLREADYEVASYGLQNNCLGILGEDTDYLIYDTCPYFSIRELCLESLDTVMLHREKLCESLNLNITDLPLLACLLGNDIIPEGMFESFRYKCLYSCTSIRDNLDKKGNIILAVADHISKVLHLHQGEKKLEEMLPLGPNKALFYKGVASYLLPGQKSPWFLQKLRGTITLDKQVASMSSDPESKQVPMRTDPNSKQEVPMHTEPESKQEVPTYTDPASKHEVHVCTDPEYKQVVPTCTEPEYKHEIPTCTHPESKHKVLTYTDPEYKQVVSTCTDPTYKQDVPMHIGPESKLAVPVHTDPETKQEDPRCIDPESKQEVPMCTDSESKQEVPMHTDCESKQEVSMCTDPESKQEVLMCTDPESKQEVPICTDPESKQEVTMRSGPEVKQKLPIDTDPESKLEVPMHIHPEIKQVESMNVEPETNQRVTKSSDPEIQQQVVIYLAPEIKQEVTVISDPEILKIAKAHHVQAESYLVYNIMCNGEIECSNTLEDELDQALPSQAFIYRPVRQRVYSLILGECRGGGSSSTVKEWFVYSGNPLKRPDLVKPLQINVPGTGKLDYIKTQICVSDLPSPRKDQARTCTFSRSTYTLIFVSNLSPRGIYLSSIVLKRQRQGHCSRLILDLLQFCLSWTICHIALLLSSASTPAQGPHQWEEKRTLEKTPHPKGGTPNLKSLWLNQEPGIQCLRFDTLLACFNLSCAKEELQTLENPFKALCCLLIYLFVQVDSLCLEDLHAFIAQAVCLQGKSASQLAGIQLDYVNSRAVQLGSLLVRGLTTLVLVNSTCGFPLRTNDFMPWNIFDGKLFHQKYLQAEKGYTVEVLVEQNRAQLTKFQSLKTAVCKACMKENRRILTRQQWLARNAARWGRQGSSYQRTGYGPGHSSQRQHWRDRGSGSRQYEHDQWRRHPSSPGWSN
ncbi:constitutive coactivator of peroxisome proliferator-activated receptor gamma isoform X1 [Dasypus novemcinctus]|uniref:constitutive coactivator of peroxisome proliferator-activated receptor gamma isoform X1 n=1 Tax=Dasypus novemcinctus TaxID=9361 RepID=UPI00265F3BA8|nr:constitutive coactivator of peroxisome proliferator-activated receptor gamma isoform X1 [Dasypus novemcinctus]